MEEKLKPRLWGLWIISAVVLLVGYPLSVPPVEYLARKGYIAAWVCLPTDPINVLVRPFPQWVRSKYIVYWVSWRMHDD